MIKKNGQGWGFDAMIATSIFFVSLIMLYVYTINTSSEAGEKIDALLYDGKSIADNLLSPGYPDNWNSTNLIRIGLLSDNKINETKLAQFYNLSLSNYEGTKAHFNTKYEYYITISEELIIEGNAIDGIGLPPTDADNVVRVTRFVIYQNKPITLYVDIWK